MSVTAESEARPKITARAKLVDWLRGYRPRVSENDTTAELIKHARALGGNSDPLIAHLIRECEAEQRARAARHDIAQRQIAQQVAQRGQQQWDVWWDSRLASAIGCNDESAIHPAFTCLLDSIARVNVDHEKALRAEIDAANKKTRQLLYTSTKEAQMRLTDLETLFWTQWQTDDKRHAEAMEQMTQRITALETVQAETGCREAPTWSHAPVWYCTPTTAGNGPQPLNTNDKSIEAWPKLDGRPGYLIG